MLYLCSSRSRHEKDMKRKQKLIELQSYCDNLTKDHMFLKKNVEGLFVRFESEYNKIIVRQKTAYVSTPRKKIQGECSTSINSKANNSLVDSPCIKLTERGRKMSTTSITSLNMHDDYFHLNNVSPINNNEFSNLIGGTPLLNNNFAVPLKKESSVGSKKAPQMMSSAYILNYVDSYNDMDDVKQANEMRQMKKSECGDRRVHTEETLNTSSRLDSWEIPQHLIKLLSEIEKDGVFEGKNGRRRRHNAINVVFDSEKNNNNEEFEKSNKQARHQSVVLSHNYKSVIKEESHSKQMSQQNLVNEEPIFVDSDLLYVERLENENKIMDDKVNQILSKMDGYFEEYFDSMRNLLRQNRGYAKQVKEGFRQGLSNDDFLKIAAEHEAIFTLTKNFENMLELRHDLQTIRERSAREY